MELFKIGDIYCLVFKDSNLLCILPARFAMTTITKKEFFLAISIMIILFYNLTWTNFKQTFTYPMWETDSNVYECSMKLFLDWKGIFIIDALMFDIDYSS